MARTDLDPSRSALLLMDYQPVVLAQAPGSESTIEKAKAARAEAKRLGVQVAYVRVAFSPQDFGSISPLNKAFSPISGGGFLLDGTPETAVVADLAPEAGDIVVTKTRFGAFSTTNLV